MCDKQDAQKGSPPLNQGIMCDKQDAQKGSPPLNQGIKITFQSQKNAVCKVHPICACQVDEIKYRLYWCGKTVGQACI